MGVGPGGEWNLRTITDLRGLCGLELFQLLCALAMMLPGGAQVTPVEHAGKAPSDLDQFIRAQTQHWNVPGLGIGVVENGQVIYSDAFGRRDGKKNLPVAPKTIFAI